MANLSVRKLDPAILYALRLQAARHGISMEEEARQILQRGVQASPNLADLASHFFGEKSGVDLTLPKRKPHNPIDFNDDHS